MSWRHVKLSILIYLFSLCSAFADRHPKFVVPLMCLLSSYYKEQLKEQVHLLIESEFKSVIAQARQHLAELTLNLAWAEGAKMTREQGLKIALKTLDEI